METLEKKYLQNTLLSLEKKLKDNCDQLKETKKELKKGAIELAENYNETSRGGDLSNFFSSIGLIEEKKEALEKENRKLDLQIKSPYFARIDFIPAGKTNAQQVYIGIGNGITEVKGSTLVCISVYKCQSGYVNA